MIRAGKVGITWYVYTLGVSAHGRSGWRLRQVVKRDLEAGTSEAFDYGPGVIAEEHVFVPRRATRNEDDGWLVGPFLDYTRGLTSEAFDYGPGVIAEEHVFVPRRAPRNEDDGWLVGPFLDYTCGLTGVGVFDARGAADGPVARAWLDYPLPLAFHGQFTPA